MTTLQERFISRVKAVTENGCWLWSGYIEPAGYGHVSIKGKTIRAHRVAFKLFRGDVPKGQLVCHRCDVRSCVNPTHLFLGTITDNNRDANNKGRSIASKRKLQTHCKHGHEFTETNTFIHDNGCRYCRRCKADWQQRYIQRKRLTQ